MNELSKITILEDTLNFNINDIDIEIYLEEEIKDREYIKIELEVIYIKLNNKWIVEDIYYC